MTTGDIFRFALESAYGGDDLVNVWHFRVEASSGTPAEEAEALALAFSTGTVLDDYRATLVSDASVVQGKVRGVTVPTAGYDVAIGEAGAASPPVLPLQNAVLVLMDTANFGRSYRGKNWHPGISELAVENGAVGAGTIALLNTFYESLDTLTNGGFEFKLGVYSRKLGVFTPRTGSRVQGYVRIQRRRTPGVGS